MKAVILCGGKGTRLREETEYRPKPLVPIGGMPVVWHVMKIYSHYGIKDFVLCLGYKGDMIKQYFLNFEELTRDFTLELRSRDARVTHHTRDGLEDWRITFVDTGEEAETGNRLAMIQPYVAGETFCFTYADSLGDINIYALLQYHRAHGRVLTCTGVHPQSAFGILDVQNGMAHAFREKPGTQDVINGGFFVCEPSLFSYVQREGTCIFERESMQRVVTDNQLAVYEHTGFWYCMDTYKQMEELNKRWKQGDAPWCVWK